MAEPEQEAVAVGPSANGANPLIPATNGIPDCDGRCADGRTVCRAWHGPRPSATEPTSLTARLLAELDAEQQIAEAATQRGGWAVGYEPTILATRQDDIVGELRHAQDVVHVAQQDPERTLRRIAALRRIVERHTPRRDIGFPQPCICGVRWPCPDLLDLADALGVEADRD